MPIYEYSCLNCNFKFEYLVRASEKITCPKCGQDKLKRLISAFSFASKDSKGNITSVSSGCSGCASHNCSTCS